MNRLLFLLAAGMTTAALIWGFSVVGGPETARMEKRDQTRHQDLQRLSQHHLRQDFCGIDIESGSALVVTSPNCAAFTVEPPHVADPRTGEAYRITRLNENTVTFCATFEIATKASANRRFLRAIEFDGHEGCIVYQRSDAEAKWRVRR